jgi:hypothetical protein
VYVTFEPASADEAEAEIVSFVAVVPAARTVAVVVAVPDVKVITDEPVAAAGATTVMEALPVESVVAFAGEEMLAVVADTAVITALGTT